MITIPLCVCVCVCVETKLVCVRQENDNVPFVCLLSYQDLEVIWISLPVRIFGAIHWKWWHLQTYVICTVMEVTLSVMVVQIQC